MKEYLLMTQDYLIHQVHQTSRVLLKRLNDYITPLGLYSAQLFIT